jgi:histone acetyltransferase (RNA polymerase elongator complex component)
MPQEEQRACLRFAARWRKRGQATAIRCSTRPDAVDSNILDFLQDNGVSMVELGVQSFSDAALAASRRGYDGRAARLGCSLVTQSGLELGIQLMPGMPGLTKDDALQDARTAVSLHPSGMRLYPCLVLRATALEHLWRNGEYHPWSFEETVGVLADACLIAWENNVPVIRMGLAPEPCLKKNILAGPAHPAIGSMARGLALARHTAKILAGCAKAAPDSLSFTLGAPLRLFAPRRHQGEFWGHKNALVPFYAALGIDRKRVKWTDEDLFVLRRELPD